MKQVLVRAVGRSLRRTRSSALHSAAIRSAIEPLEARALLTTIYVDANAPGVTTNGSSWGTAFLDLQAGLSAATSGDEIHIADGTYKPTATTTRTISFDLKASVPIRGGYAGYGAGTPDARSASTPTILSGDIGTTNDASDNSFHVLTATNVSPTELDGLTITGGNADGTGGGVTGKGGGLYSYNTSTLPRIKVCTFTANTAVLGGAMYNDHSFSVFNVNITDSTFSSNTAGSGGAIYNYDADTTFNHCTFSNNSATVGDGGAIYSAAISVALAEYCTFTGMSAAGSGGAIFSTGSIVEADNCSFLSCTAGADGGAITSVVSFSGGMHPANITGCSFVGNTAGTNGGALSIASDYEQITNSTFTGNSAPSASGGAIYADSSTVSVRNSILWGDTGGEIVKYSSTLSVSYSDVQGGYTGTANINTDPQFLESPDLTLANPHYGNLELRIGSPGVNSGNDSVIASGTTTNNVGVTADIVGQADGGDRIFGTHVDMGAYEQVTDTWVGSGTGGWSNTANWSLSRIPNQYDVASIPSGVTVQVGSGAYPVGQLDSSSDLQISTGTLELFGDASLTGVLTLSSGGSLDIQEYTLAIHFSTDPVSTIEGYIASAFNAGSWTGSGLTSSKVAANSGHHWRVGYFDGNTDTVGGAAANELLIRPLLAADANGDGAVDFNDYIIIAQNYNGSAGWAHADFDYDGVCDFDDLTTYTQESGYNTHTRPLW